MEVYALQRAFQGYQEKMFFPAPTAIRRDYPLRGTKKAVYTAYPTSCQVI
jgi:hypothetical protein